jgi:hypothetical protein
MITAANVMGGIFVLSGLAMAILGPVHASRPGDAQSGWDMLQQWWSR